MSFETESEKLFNSYIRITELNREFEYIEYGQDFVRFKRDGGNVFEIKVREIKNRVKPLRGK